MIITIVSKVCFSSIGSLAQSTLPHLRNPFAYIGRTVSKFDSVGLRNGKRPDGFKAHHRDLCEIKRQTALRRLLVLCQFLQHLDGRTVNASTHAEHHKPTRSNNPFNFARHRGSPLQARCDLALRPLRRRAFSCPSTYRSHRSSWLTAPWANFELGNANEETDGTHCLRER